MNTRPPYETGEVYTMGLYEPGHGFELVAILNLNDWSRRVWYKYVRRIEVEEIKEGD